MANGGTSGFSFSRAARSRHSSTTFGRFPAQRGVLSANLVVAVQRIPTQVDSNRRIVLASSCTFGIGIDVASYGLVSIASEFAQCLNADLAGDQLGQKKVASCAKIRFLR